MTGDLTVQWSNYTQQAMLTCKMRDSDSGSNLCVQSASSLQARLSSVNSAYPAANALQKQFKFLFVACAVLPLHQEFHTSF